MGVLIIIAGPTAVGKTDLAIRLARQLKTEIISADSMQVYKYMDIGAAKPDLTQPDMVKHHLINLVEPDQEFSVADYQDRFEKTITLFNNNGMIPLITGGTGLYIRACAQSFSLDNPANPDYKLRDSLKKEAELKGREYLHRELALVDPEAAVRIHPNDLGRIIRALEVYLVTGSPISKLQTKKKAKYQTIYLFLERERRELYERINDRVDSMMQRGLLAEVESLLRRGYSANLKPMQSLGYKQLNDYLAGRIDLAAAIDLIKLKTRNYAKRQLTWFNREPVDRRFNLTGKNEEFYGEILNYIEGCLNAASNNNYKKEIFNGGSQGDE